MKVTAVETLRLDEYPNVLWVFVHTDEGLARADGGVNMRAA